MEVKIVNLPSLGVNFPKPPVNEIIRDNIFTVINSYFETGKNIVFIEGEGDLGKTTLLRQYALSKSSNTFSTFLTSLSPDYIYDYVINDLCNQMNWYLTNTEIDLGDANRSFFQKLLLKLRRERSKKNQQFYFVIDGLGDIDPDNLHAKGIFSDLPFGEEGFNFLISGNTDSYSPFISKTHHDRIWQYPLTPFTREEVKKYLMGFECCKAIDQDEFLLNAIRSSCNDGSPGKLEHFVRILTNSGSTPSELLEELENKSFYDLDWYSIEGNHERELLCQLIAFISLDKNIYSTQKLSKLLEKDEQMLRNTISTISFLEINEKSEVNLISLAHKRFFSKKLKQYEDYTINTNINYLTSNQHSEESLLQLPNYLAKVKKYPEIMQLISVDYLPKIIGKIKSLGPLREKLRIGYMAAEALNHDSGIIQYAGQMSLLENIEGLHVWDSEIEARISLGDYDNAIKLAQSALLKEDQLRLLSRIAKQRSIKKLPKDVIIQNQIHKIYDEINFEVLKSSKVIDIASDLLYSEPSLALNLVQITSNSDKLRTVESWAVAKLSISAVKTEESSEAVDTKIDKIASVINDPKMERLNRALTFLIANYSTEKFLHELKGIGSDKDKLTFVELWIGNNKKKDDVHLVIDFALNLLVKISSKVFPKTRILSELASSLISVKDDTMILDLVNRFEDFDEDIKRLGPTIEYFDFKANLVKAIFKLDYNRSIRFWEGLIKIAGNEKDVVSRAECYAILNGLLIEIGSRNLGKSQQYYSELLPSAFKNTVSRLLNITADHVSSLKEVIRIVAKADPKYAGELALKANILSRRDMLLYYTVTGNLENHISEVRIDTLLSIIENVTSYTWKEASVRSVLQKFRAQNSIDEKQYNSILEIRSTINSLQSNAVKTHMRSLLLQILALYQHRDENIVKAILDELKESWTKLSDDEISMIETAYFIADDLESIDRVNALNFLKEAEQLRKKIWVDSVNTIQLYFQTVRLTLRVSAGLLKTAGVDDKIKIISQLIDKIPSKLWQVSLYSELAFLALQKEDINLTLKILKNNIKPLYNSLNDLNVKQKVLVKISLLLYTENQITALGEISNLSTKGKEDSISSIISFKLSNEIPTESYTVTDKPSKPDFDNVETAMKLIEYLETDSVIYVHIKTICDIVSDYKKYSDIQTTNVFRELKGLIDKKLPNKKYIKHDGFKIISLAQIGKISKKYNRDIAYYENLISLSKKIENQSDKIFVYTILAEIISELNLRSRQNGIATKLIGDSLKLLEELKCNVEFINRIDDISKVLKKVNPSEWKRKITDALKLTMHLSNRYGIEEKQKSIIDTAYRLDKKFAESLINLFDKDESRRHSKNLKQRIRFFKIKEKINNSKGKEVVKKSEVDKISSACYSLLSELNSNQIVTKEPAELRWLLNFASTRPFLDSISIYEYYFQNLTKRYDKRIESEEFVNDSFKSLIALSDLLRQLAIDYKKNDHIKMSTDYDALSASSIVFKPGNREESVTFMSTWIIDHGKKYIKICDPYFDKNDLELVKGILEFDRSIKVDILTSLESRENVNLEMDFQEHWEQISSEDPPRTDITVVINRANNKSPFHDRYIITEGSGLRLGTSIKDVGEGKVAEISKMDSNEAFNAEKDAVDIFLNREVHEFEGKRLKYKTFEL